MRASSSSLSTLRLALGPREAAYGAKIAPFVALLLVQLAIVVALEPWSMVARAAGVVGLVAAAGFVHHVLSRMREPPLAWCVADDQGLRRGNRPMVEWREPFGLTVLASKNREQIMLVFTSPRETLSLGVRAVDPGDVAEAPTLLARAVSVAWNGIDVDDRIALSAADAERLLVHVGRRVPGALDRIFLLDGGGEPVVLDQDELRAGGRRIDLLAPLEWRPFLFAELGPLAIQTYWQATWIRQGDHELVLVAPLVSDILWLDDAPEARLVQNGWGEPPPREQRRAIDNLFMLPLRLALARAPRISRSPSSARFRPEGRA